MGAPDAKVIEAYTVLGSKKIIKLAEAMSESYGECERVHVISHPASTFKLKWRNF